MRRRAGLALDALVVLAGLLIAAYAVSAWAGLHERQWPLLLGAPVVVLMARYPLVLMRVGGDIEIGFDSAVLVFLALNAPPAEALAVWSIGTLLSQALERKAVASRVFNVGLCIVAGSVAVTVMSAIAPLDRMTPRTLTAVALGCALYFAVDFLVTAWSIALASGEPV